LKDEIKRIALKEGASKVGIASVESFAGVPKGHAPADFIPDAKSVISFGIELLDAAVERDRLFLNSQMIPEEFRGSVQEYLYNTVAYSMVNSRLDQIGLSIALFLEKQGYPSICFPATYVVDEENGPIMSKIPDFLAPFSHRHAAVRAGLGEFGLSNLVLSPEYGPRIRLNSVITSMQLEPDPIIREKLCRRGCTLCMKACASCAYNSSINILTPKENLNWNEIWLGTPSVTNKHVCYTGRCAGGCVRACPVGSRRTHRRQEKEKSSISG
jgi:epoxyqueuosine reductase QueG